MNLFAALTLFVAAQHTHPPAAPTATSPKAAHPETHQEIALSTDDIRAVGLRTELPSQRDFSRTVRAVATISTDERRVAHVHTKFSGYIEKLHVNFIGKRVNKGDRLVEIFSPEVLAAQSEFVVALNQRDAAKKRGASDVELKSRQSFAKAARQRLALWDVSPAFLNRLEKSRKPKRTITLYSPIAGTVITKEAVEGLYIGPEAHLFVVADLASVWAVADIYAHELEDVRVGMEAKLEVEGLSGDRPVRIDYVSPTVSPVTRTVTVRATVDNRDGRLKPGAFATLSLRAEGSSGLAIPDGAVLLTGERAVIFVQTGPGRFRAREVRLGRRVPGWYEVKEGLEPDEPVVVAAQFVLDAESQLRSGGSGGHGGH